MSLTLSLVSEFPSLSGFEPLSLSLLTSLSVSPFPRPVLSSLNSFLSSTLTHTLKPKATCPCLSCRLKPCKSYTISCTSCPTLQNPKRSLSFFFYKEHREVDQEGDPTKELEGNNQNRNNKSSPKKSALHPLEEEQLRGRELKKKKVIKKLLSTAYERVENPICGQLPASPPPARRQPKQSLSKTPRPSPQRTEEKTKNQCQHTTTS